MSFMLVELLVLSIVIIFFFFFSSRRRHTRLTCDWSSDVCSSDLDHLMQVVADPGPERSAEGSLRPVHDLTWQPALRRPLEGDLALPAPDLGGAPDGERSAGDDGVDERDAYLDRGRHARPVGIGQVEPGQEQTRISQAHPVDFVVQ